MTLSKTSGQPCKSCEPKKGKLQRIMEGWGNYLFLNKEVESMAKYRALRCATCDFNKLEVCSKCFCPISIKTRSMEEKCEINRW